MKIKLFSKTNHENKSRKLITICSIMLFITLTAISYFLVTMDKKPEEKVKAKTPTIALVNEDIASKFNNHDYNFGKSFVDLVSNDTKYHWQVVSRAVAEKAYIDGSIDAVIYLPQSFSSDLVTLQDIDPRKAKVDYKVQSQKNELSEKVLKDRIISVLYDFNQSIVKMYYSSVAGNIAEAESQMNTTVGKQENLVAGLSAGVENPFKDSLSNYENFISGTNSLNVMNKGNVSLQNSFTDNTKKVLNQTKESFSSQLPQITTYFDTQKKIATLNVENANKGITSQTDNDHSFYYNLFNELNTNAVDGLSAFYQEEQNETSNGYLTELQNKVNSYNTLIVETQENVAEQITTLTNKRTELLSLENDLYNQFFSQDINTTVDNFDQYEDIETDENARIALGEKLQTSLGKTDNFSQAGYIEKLFKLIGEISLKPSDYKLADLANNHTITESTKTKYEEELQLIRQYATAFGVGSDSGEKNLGEEVPSIDGEVNQILKKNYTINVPPETTYFSSSFPEDIKINAEPQEGLKINSDNSITLENLLQTKQDNSQEPGISKTFKFDVSVNLGDRTSYSFITEWKAKENDSTKSIWNTSNSFELMPKDRKADYNAYLADNFETFTEILGRVDLISSMITTIYGSPGDNYSDLLSSTVAADFNNKSLESIYNMYGNIELSTLVDRLSNNDVEAYQSMGQSNLKKMVQTIEGLNTSIDELEKDKESLESNLPENYFTENLSSLTKWYLQTSQKIDESFNSWQKQSAANLELKEWDSYDGSKTELYKETTDTLYNQIQSLVKTTEKSTGTIAENSNVVKDNSSQFEKLVDQATTTQKEAKNMLKDTGTLVSRGTESVTESKEFYKEFSKTLANTRTKGVDKKEIYNFFASPIESKDITPKQSKITEVKMSFDVRLVILFIIGLLFGVLIMIFGRSSLIRKQK